MGFIHRKTSTTDSFADGGDRGGVYNQALLRLRLFVHAQYVYLRRRLAALIALVHVTLRSLYFPDEVSLYLDTFVRLLFSVYYIPFLVMVLAVSHAAIERIVWVLVIPVTQEMERRPLRTSSVWTLASGLSSISSRMLPFATLAVAAATVGHKLINCVAEAMVDAYTTQRDLDYPLLRARLRFTFKKRSRILIGVVVAVALAVALVLLCHTNAFVEWSGREPWVTAASWTIFVVQICFVCTTMLREAPLEGTRLTRSRMFRRYGHRKDILLNQPQVPTKDDVKHDEAGAVDASQSTMEQSNPQPASSPSMKHDNDGFLTSVPRNMNNNSSLLDSGVSHSEDNGNLYSRQTSFDSVALEAPFHPPLPEVLDGESGRGASAERRDEDSEASESATARAHANFAGPFVSEKIVSYVEDDWWRHYIHMMRHISFFMVVSFCVVFAVSQGPVFGLMSGVMIMSYLNLPHLFGYSTLAIASEVTRTLRSFAWLCRHMDALFPFMVLVMPYQIMLMNAVLYYRHHFLLCIMLLGVNMLLVARAIDLVREYDVTVNGSVLWKYANSGALLPPSLAVVLEDGHEKQYRWPDVVSLDMSIDIRNMKIVYAGGAEVGLKRQVVFPRGALRRYFFDHRFYAYTLPRLLSLQSPGYFGGTKFRTMRVVLRFISMTLLLAYALLVSGLIVQAAFPQLRPLPVRVTAAPDNSHVTLDHIVVRMHLLSQNASRRQAEANTSSSVIEGYLSGLPEAASSAFMWNNITSADGEDFYPQLCTREYHNTSVWELALLSVAPYLFNVEEFNSLLHFLNTHMGSDWVIQPRYGTSCVPGDSNHRPTGWSDFYEVHSKRRDTSIIAVRGTDMFSFTDFLFNINLFFEVALYQLMTTFIPGSAVVPKDLVVDLLRTASLPADSYDDVYETWAELTRSGNHSLRRCQQNNYGRDYFADLYNHIAYIGSRPVHPRHILLTGHSLGGAVSSIVASQMGVKAVAFSAPGVVLARKKFNFTLRSLHQNVMTVISSNDIVPAVGEHGGEVHHVECLAATRELCHAMEFMIGSLWRSCSSVRARFPSIKDVI